MSSFEIVSQITHNGLMNKSKWDLVNEILHLHLPSIDALQALLAQAEKELAHEKDERQSTVAMCVQLKAERDAAVNALRYASERLRFNRQCECMISLSGELRVQCPVHAVLAELEKGGEGK